jgi:hypothetical protein
MPNPETDLAYASLERDWPGHCLRLHPVHRGDPDYLLTYGHRRYYLVEVKAAQSNQTVIDLRLNQRLTLNKLHQQKVSCLVLVFVEEAFWVAFYPPLQEQAALYAKEGIIVDIKKGTF